MLYICYDVTYDISHYMRLRGKLDAQPELIRAQIRSIVQHENTAADFLLSAVPPPERNSPDSEPLLERNRPDNELQNRLDNDLQQVGWRQENAQNDLSNEIKVQLDHTADEVGFNPDTLVFDPKDIEGAVEESEEVPKPKSRKAPQSKRRHTCNLCVDVDREYSFEINEPTKCKHKDVFLLVLVTSIHANFEKRRSIRNTWGGVKNEHGLEVVTLFLLGGNNNNGMDKVIREESQSEHDIILADFIDTYKNLTLKTLMGMRYASTYCPKARFVMKTDDDMYINIKRLVKVLGERSTPTTRYVTGYSMYGNTPIRDKSSKWYVSKDIYPEDHYPPFCSGTGYVMSGDVATKIHDIATSVRFLHLEDVFVGMCLDQLAIRPKGHKGFHIENVKYKFCDYKRLVTSHWITAYNIELIWREQNSRKRSDHCYGL